MKKSSGILSLFLAATLICSVLFPSAVYAATENQLRSKVVSVAQAEIGYKDSSTHSKYGNWYGYQGGWCTTFVLWCFNKAGNAYDTKLYGNIIPSGGNCNSMISWFSNKGRYHKASSGYTPKSGDLIFFDWSGNGSSQHVGIVDYTSGSTVYTIEGNCSGEVKARSYTKSGSKPYNNISSIMGYGEPDFASVSSGKGSVKTTAKKTTARKTKTKKTTTKKAITKKTTAVSTTAKKTTEKKTTKKEATTSAKASTTAKTTAKNEVTKLSINASTYELQVGDTVKLNYSVEPQNAPAVVGYFCDEEGIIEIGSAGEIKAIGEGTATVVVCANDTLYRQCDFTVTQAVADVTKVHEASSTRKVVGKAEQTVVTTEKTAKTVLSRVGVNLDALAENRQIYIVPLAIAGATVIISLFAVTVRKIKEKIRRKKED